MQEVASSNLAASTHGKLDEVVVPPSLSGALKRLPTTQWATSACGNARLGNALWNRGIGSVAQTGERPLGMREVAGSIPVRSTRGEVRVRFPPFRGDPGRSVTGARPREEQSPNG
jgi:hypothetical protein